MVLYPVPSNHNHPPARVPVGYIYIGVKGEMFMWNGADWEEIDEDHIEWAMLRFTVEELERKKRRDKTPIV